MSVQARALRPVDMLGAFLVLGAAYLAAGSIVGVLDAWADLAWGRWLALHLAFVGGVSQLILGASQFFIAAFLATDPPPRRLVRAQVLVWNAGALAVALSRPLELSGAAELGAALLLGGLVLYVAGLRSMQRRSLQRARWAPRWYQACAVFLALGAVAGALLARGTSWSAGDLLGAHLALNVGGWFGTAIVGTLHTFFPSLTGTRLRFPALEPLVLGGWVAGVLCLASGYAFDADAAIVAGWILLLAACVCLAANLVASVRARTQPLSTAAGLVALGQAFLPAGLAFATATALLDDARSPLVGDARGILAVLLLAGWVGLTVAGSLIHLGGVVRRVRARGAA